MKAMDVMVRDVVTVKPETDVASAIKLLIEHDISALPVVDDGGRVVGMLSEADLVRRAEIGTDKQRPWWLEALTPGSMLAEEFAKAHGLRASEVMSPHVVSASEETPLAEIATLLEKHRIKRVPIIEDGKLVGIVSRRRARRRRGIRRDDPILRLRRALEVTGRCRAHDDPRDERGHVGRRQDFVT
jgi:CBS domain-containing protein